MKKERRDSEKGSLSVSVHSFPANITFSNRKFHTKYFIAIIIEHEAR